MGVDCVGYSSWCRHQLCHASGPTLNLLQQTRHSAIISAHTPARVIVMLMSRRLSRRSGWGWSGGRARQSKLEEPKLAGGIMGGNRHAVAIRAARQHQCHAAGRHAATPPSRPTPLLPSCSHHVLASSSSGACSASYSSHTWAPPPYQVPCPSCSPACLHGSAAQQPQSTTTVPIQLPTDLSPAPRPPAPCRCLLHEAVQHCWWAACRRHHNAWFPTAPLLGIVPATCAASMRAM